MEVRASFSRPGAIARSKRTFQSSRAHVGRRGGGGLRAAPARQALFGVRRRESETAPGMLIAG